MKKLFPDTNFCLKACKFGRNIYVLFSMWGLSLRLSLLEKILNLEVFVF